MATGTLTSQTIANTYKSLLKITGTTAGGETLHATTLKVIEDGDGNPFPLSAAQDALMITSTNRLEFGDAGTYIFQSSDGVLDLVSDTEIELNATTLDINANVDISGNIIMADDTSIGIGDSSERIEFDGAGDITFLGCNVGIGTTTPYKALDVYSAFAITNTDWDGDGTGSRILFELGATSGDTYGEIHVQDEGGNSNGNLSLLNNGGNVGIGTVSPISKLEIEDGTGTGGAILTLGTKETSVVANDVLGRINFYAPLDTGTDSDEIAASIAAVAQDTFSDSVNSTSLYFQTGKSEVATTKMVIDEDGNVGIGIVPPTTLLDVRGSSTSAAMLQIINAGNNANAFGMVIQSGTAGASAGALADSRPLIFNDGDGTALGGVNAGTTAAPAFFAPSSDERLKENITNTSIVGLDVINGLTMKAFNFIKYGTDVPTDIGFIAQNCESVYPKMVSELDDDDTKANWGVDHSVKTVSDGILVPVLVKAIQELSAKVTALESS